MPKCDFNKVSNFIEIALRHGCSPVNLLHIFRTPFPKNTSGRLLLFLEPIIYISHFYADGLHFVLLRYAFTRPDDDVLKIVLKRPIVSRLTLCTTL